MRCRWRSPVWLAFSTATVVLMWSSAPLCLGQDRELRIGESIRVGPQQELKHTTCIACSIHIEGQVGQSALVVLGELVNRGSISGNAIVIAGRMENDGLVGGDVLVSGGVLESDGGIDGDATVVAGNLEMRGEVGGDALIVVGSTLLEGASARIRGDVTTVLGTHQGLEAGAVHGTISQFTGERLGRLVLTGLIGVSALALVAYFGILVGLNLLGCSVLGRRRLEVMAGTLAEHAPACLLLGLGSGLVLSVAGLVVSLVLPVSVPVLVIFCVLSVVGYCGLTYAIALNQFRRVRRLLGVAFAALLVAAIQIIPLVGWLVMLVLWNVGIGSVVLSGFGSTTDWLMRRARTRRA